MPERKKDRQKLKKALDNRRGKNSAQSRKATRNEKPLKSHALRTAKPRSQRSEKALASLTGELLETEAPRKGRPTIPNNFLLGSRNAWLSFFELCWHEIGWSLLEIRKQESSTTEDVQRAFAPLAAKDKGSLALVFSRGSPEPVDAKELRANRIRSCRLHSEIQRTQLQRRDLELSLAEAERALKEASDENRELFQNEAGQRKTRLLQHDENLRKAEDESKGLDKRVEDQETYWYCSRLLDFLRRGKYAVEPLKLANALAGLPQMGWQASFARCSRMPRDQYVQFPYRVFQVVSRIWRRRPKELQNAPTEFFKVEILKLPKKGDSIRETLFRGWRDLRLAIEECWNARHIEDFMPYAITAAFIRNKEQTKTAAERIMDEREMLSRN